MPKRDSWDSTFANPSLPNQPTNHYHPEPPSSSQSHNPFPSSSSFQSHSSHLSSIPLMEAQQSQQYQDASRAPAAGAGGRTRGMFSGISNRLSAHRNSVHEDQNQNMGRTPEGYYSSAFAFEDEYLNSQSRNPTPQPNNMPPQLTSSNSEFQPPTLPFAPRASLDQPNSNPNGPNPNPNGSNGLNPSSRRDSSISLTSKSSHNTKDPSSSSKADRKSGTLSTFYIPSKFSNLNTGAQNAYRLRRPAKRGGGRGAWDMSTHGRMGGEDEDSFALGASGSEISGVGGVGGVGERGVRFGDSVPEGAGRGLGRGGARGKGKGGKGRKMAWNRFKWGLFVANTVLTLYALATLIAALLVYFDVYDQSDVILVGNRTELIISTAAGALCLLTALLGYAGIILNNRAFLAIYNLFLWFCLALIVTPGYLTYKQREFNLEGKINAQWSRDLGIRGRLRVQNQLDCCGYFNPFVEATASNTCYPRSILPGCKNRYLRFERGVLRDWYTASFVLVPVHIIIIVVALLSSNNVTYRLGKGMVPKQYRLDEASTAQLLNAYAADIAAQYPNLAQEALHRSSSNNYLNEKYPIGAAGHGQIKSSRASSFSSLRQ